MLAGIELRDRIESGWRSARSLMGRIRSARRQPSELVRRAAQRVLLLGEALDALEAGEPADAVLRVDGDPEFGPRLSAMYRAWARERGMRLEDVSETPGRRYRWSASVTGFGALRILRPEAGLHVLETPDGRGGYERRRVRVTVTPGEARRGHDRASLPRAPDAAGPRLRARVADRAARLRARRRLRSRRVSQRADVCCCSCPSGTQSSPAPPLIDRVSSRDT